MLAAIIVPTTKPAGRHRGYAPSGGKCSPATACTPAKSRANPDTAATSAARRAQVGRAFGVRRSEGRHNPDRRIAPPVLRSMFAFMFDVVRCSSLILPVLARCAASPRCLSRLSATEQEDDATTTPPPLPSTQGRCHFATWPRIRQFPLCAVCAGGIRRIAVRLEARPSRSDQPIAMPSDLGKMPLHHARLRRGEERPTAMPARCRARAEAHTSRQPHEEDAVLRCRQTYASSRRLSCRSATRRAT